MDDGEKTSTRTKKGRRRTTSRRGVLKIGNLGRLRGLPVRADLVQANELSHLLIMPVPAVLAGGLSASLISTIVATRLADSILSDQTRAFDHKVLDMARGARRSDKRPLDPIMSLLSAAGEPWTLYPMTALIAARWV